MLFRSRPVARPVATGQPLPVAAIPRVAAAPRIARPQSVAPTRPAVERRPEGPAFVPDFSGQTIVHARRLAQSESLTLSVFGATSGRVVSQLPVPGTVLEGNDRTVLLEFAPRREES